VDGWINDYRKLEEEGTQCILNVISTGKVYKTEQCGD
jgi:hypothetical protein